MNSTICLLSAKTHVQVLTSQHSISSCTRGSHKPPSFSVPRLTTTTSACPLFSQKTQHLLLTTIHAESPVSPWKAVQWLSYSFCLSEMASLFNYSTSSVSHPPFPRKTVICCTTKLLTILGFFTNSSE